VNSSPINTPYPEGNQIPYKENTAQRQIKGLTVEKEECSALSI
jgi:hypothetical protein